MKKKQKILREGKAKFYIYEYNNVSSKMPVFYNPLSSHKHTLQILFLRSYFKKPARILIPLAATGVEGIRMVLEGVKIKELWLNDKNPIAYEIIKKNLKLNNLNSKDIHVSCKDANVLINENKGFDYIDIDDFGEPDKFLDAAIRTISTNGILGVTSTRISPLTGRTTSACRMLYWATPINNHLKHEGGIRILIRKVQLLASQYEKVAYPLVSIFKNHYYKIFFKVIKKKSLAKDILKFHSYVNYDSKTTSWKLAKFPSQNSFGPFYIGKLHDKSIVKNMLKLSYYYEDKPLIKYLTTLSQEAEVDTLFFYDTAAISKTYSLKSQPPLNNVISGLREKGKKASRTIFSNTGIKTEASLKHLLKIIQEISSHP